MTNVDTKMEVMERDSGEPMASRPTRRDLIERGLDVIDRDKASQIKISRVAGGVAFADAAQIMQWAQLMSVAGEGVPPHLRAQPGLCLRIVSSAIHWGMDPFGVGDKSYIVNGRLGWESQLVHGVIEARAPLQHRLDCRYDGEGPTRTCTVIGHFTTGDTREYTSPEIGKIKIKNSPLWTTDPDQQLFYYASRSWARKWCPDVLLGVYTREELSTDRSLGREVPDDTAGLHARLIGSPRSEEGHRAGHVESELEQVAANGSAPAESDAEQGATEPRAKSNQRTSDRPKASLKAKKAEKEQKAPKGKAKSTDVKLDVRKVKTVDQYIAYATQWIGLCDDADALFAQWNDERKLRNEIGVTADDRAPLDELIANRRGEF